LKTVEIHGGWKPMCFNCAGCLLTLNPMPKTLAELRDVVSRERRKKDRRFGKPDTRVFRYERRVGERRFGRDAYPAIDDDMIIEMIIEVSPDDGDDFENDLTAIRELVADLRPSELAG
jgi:hypothetical protein